MGLLNFLSGIVPTSTIQTEIYWKEMDGDSEWVWHAHNCGILLFIFSTFDFQLPYMCWFHLHTGQHENNEQKCA